jgi:hypothetical protein
MAINIPSRSLKYSVSTPSGPDDTAFDGVNSRLATDPVDGVIYMQTPGGGEAAVQLMMETAETRYLFIRSNETDYCVIWDIRRNTAATGILNPEDEEITEWPVLYSEVQPWISQLSVPVSYDNLFENTSLVTQDSPAFDCEIVDGTHCGSNDNTVTTCLRSTDLGDDHLILSTTYDFDEDCSWTTITFVWNRLYHTGNIYTAQNQSAEAVMCVMAITYNATSIVDHSTELYFSSTLELAAANPYADESETRIGPDGYILADLSNGNLTRDYPILNGGYSEEDSFMFSLLTKHRLHFKATACYSNCGPEEEEGVGEGDKFLGFAAVKSSGDVDIAPSTISEAEELTIILNELVNKDDKYNPGEFADTATLTVQVRKLLGE